jgi:hypothetical protein
MLRQRVNEDVMRHRLANLSIEEPDALIAHVRICVGAGAGNRPVYPTIPTFHRGMGFRVN